MTFSLLDTLYADTEMVDVFSAKATVAAWLEVEVALARVQADLGIIPAEASAAIAAACSVDQLDFSSLWAGSRNVGYPILPLVRVIDERLPESAKGYLHLGSTTQDIMDTGLALQLVRARHLVGSRLQSVGDALATQIDAHTETVMAGRTHGQQAVPTTFGAKLAVFLDQFDRHRLRLRQHLSGIGAISLHGAGGTSAAYGHRVADIRAGVADELGLAADPVPWHAARDRVVEFGLFLASTAETCVRLAREVIDLARTEIGEVREGGEHHHGASSTMPQKSNPVWSEAILGFGVVAASTAPGLLRSMEAGHERAAGEWQAEWHLLPQVAVATASSLGLSARVVEGMVVDVERMRSNLNLDGRLIMAEGLMMRLARTLGREKAHNTVYEAAVRLRGNPGSSLQAEVATLLPELTIDATEIAPDEYLGEAAAICEAALSHWRGGT